ncbi:hypothetical protein TNCV_959621 [Trichonephila clavipes]|nr:hypothetical protein TNCV_959621 [Trichonephila clavipes]
MLKHVKGSDTLSQAQDFECHRRFREDRESVEDDKRSGCSQSSHTAENIENVSAAVRKNRLQTISESVGISSTTCQWILTEDLKVSDYVRNRDFAKTHKWIILMIFSVT